MYGVVVVHIYAGRYTHTPVITRRPGTHAWCMGCRWFRCDNAYSPILLSVIIQSPQARKPLDRMCVHAGDGQTYLVGVDSMS